LFFISDQRVFVLKRAADLQEPVTFGGQSGFAWPVSPNRFGVLIVFLATACSDCHHEVVLAKAKPSLASMIFAF
jgi:hypothetical protein